MRRKITLAPVCLDHWSDVVFTVNRFAYRVAARHEKCVKCEKRKNDLKSQQRGVTR
jgi:hypothetical protein